MYSSGCREGSRNTLQVCMYGMLARKILILSLSSALRSVFYMEKNCQSYSDVCIIG